MAAQNEEITARYEVVILGKVHPREIADGAKRRKEPGQLMYEGRVKVGGWEEGCSFTDEFHVMRIGSSSRVGRRFLESNNKRREALR